MADEKKKQPTVFILYVPGGAMLGIIPALTLSRLEALTETSTPNMFQVIEGVSTGAILAAGFNIPGMNARKGAELFVQLGPQFFPEMPGRWAKMYARNGINIAKFFYNLDPKRSDNLAIQNIRQLCDAMKEQSDPVIHPVVNELEEEATQRWLAAKDQKYILGLCQQIIAYDQNLKKYADGVAELLATRTFKSRLSIIFKSAAVNVMDSLKNTWAKKEECLYDPLVPQQTYQKMFGDRMIGNTTMSTYISAYDIVNNRVVTFSSLKKDIFSKDPNAPATVRNNIKLWDAVMASTANPLAFPPHITETNLLCSDKAPIHKPRSVKDVLAAVEPGTRVVLVVAGTGKYLAKDLLQFLEKNPEDPNMSEHERYRRKLEILREYYTEFGVAGNLALGRELAELEGYTTSDAFDDFKEKLGEENIIMLAPRLSPHSPQEKRDFPSRDVLDASRDNIKKIIKRGRSLAHEEDDQLRKLAQMIADNLHLLGQMDDVKYARVCKKIGLETPNTEAEIRRDTAGIEERIASNDNSSGLRRIWRAVSRAVVRVLWEDDATPPPPKPPGPRGP